ncbi:MAG: LSU ribosomal protein L23p (L23Ae), partial [uncultured Craurococcus sp.]
ERGPGEEAAPFAGAHVPDHPFSGGDGEGDAADREGAGRLQGVARSDEAGDQGLGRDAVRREGARGQHPRGEGQDEALPQPAGPAFRLEEGHRAPGRGPDDRSDDGARL